MLVILTVHFDSNYDRTTEAAPAAAAMAARVRHTAAVLSQAVRRHLT